MPWRLFVAVFCSAMLLAACGQKGDLYFPPETLALHEHQASNYL